MHYLYSSSRPKRYLSDQDEEAGNLNPEFSELEQQDQLLVFLALILHDRKHTDENGRI